MLLKKLTESSGVSGNETEVRNLIIKEIEDYVDDIKVDRMGNIIAYKEGKKSNTDKKLMLAAHMDEIGLMVNHIDDYGLIKFKTVGGIDKRILVSKQVVIGKRKVPGVIGAKPIHLQEPSERNKPLEINELYIDIGAESREDAMKHVSIGDYVMFHSPYTEFGEDLIKAKALDDRVGCGVIIELLKNMEDVSFYGVFTTMEEIGLRGARGAAFTVEPDYSIVLEGTVCYDSPGVKEHLMPTKIGNGPAVSLIDRTTIYDKDIRDKVTAIAEENNIPYQFRLASTGGNDSGSIHISKEGSKTTTISVPCRYIHSPTSVASLKDFENTYKLTYKIMEAFNEGEII